jgi:tetratricopeptide (TPR) repeat protein
MFRRKPKYFTEPELRRWAEKQIKKGVPLGKICTELMAMVDRSPLDLNKLDNLGKSTVHNHACLNLEQAIFQTMIDRNETARRLERAGQIEDAIALYEQSVRDLFIGTFPYNRLRIIYTKQKRYEDAIRVCQAYINNPCRKALKGGKGKSKGSEPFQEWIRKLKEKMKEGK